MREVRTVGRIFLARHGQSVFNAERRFTGWRETPLTMLGDQEAHAAARRLAAATVSLSAIFSSDLERARQTAQIIRDDLACPSPLEVRAAFRERDYGELTGLNKEEAISRFGSAAVLKWRRGYADRPPGGENLQDVVARCLPCFLGQVLPAAMRGGDVLVVAHGNSVRALVTGIEELEPAAAEALEIATGEIVGYAVGADATLRRMRPGS